VRFLALAFVVALLLTGSVGSASAGRHTAEHDPGAYWRVTQAESISTVRGMRVRVRSCQGLGRARIEAGVRRYRHFRCLAGARASWDTYDTVAVKYVLHPLGPFAGRRSRYALTQVRFVGGPGIP
jgi:hypothetical protein